MKGLHLSEKYFFEYGFDMLKRKFPAYADRVAAGLVGEGSDCFGYDDEVSRDHDWGPGFCFWLNAQDFKAIGDALQSEYELLPRSFAGYTRVTTPQSGKRTGVFEINSFYARFTGLAHTPESLSEWRVLRDDFLAAATNGKVFSDPSGAFSKYREALKSFYPRDIRLKRIAARCMSAGQSGQYNFTRCLMHKEYVAAHQALGEFIKASISLVFLLNHRYMPFYKWMHRALQGLPVLGQRLYPMFESLVFYDMHKSPEPLCEPVETIAKIIIDEIRAQGLSDIKSDFLLDHGPAIHQKISNADLRCQDVMSD